MIRSNTAHDLFQLDSEVPSTWMGNGTTDISAIYEYGWYEWVYYRDEKAVFPHDSEILGRYLGPAPDIDGEMCMRILNATGKVRHRTTMRHLTPAKLLSEESKAARLAFDAAIAVSRGPAFTKMDFTNEEDTLNFEAYYAGEASGDASSNRMPEANEYNHDAFDKYLSTEVVLPTGDHMLRSHVKSRGMQMVTSSDMPILTQFLTPACTMLHFLMATLPPTLPTSSPRIRMPKSMKKAILSSSWMKLLTMPWTALPFPLMIYMLHPKMARNTCVGPPRGGSYVYYGKTAPQAGNVSLI